MLREHEVVALTRPVAEHGLEAGDVGAIVLVHADGAAYEVEFVTSAGDTVAVLTLAPDDVRRLSGAEILHVRPLAFV